MQLTGSRGPYSSADEKEVASYKRWLGDRAHSSALIGKYKASQYESTAGDGFASVAESVMGGDAVSQLSAEEMREVQIYGEQKAAVISAGIDIVTAGILSGSGKYTNPQSEAVAKAGRSLLLGVLRGQAAKYEIGNFLLQSGAPEFARLSPSQADPSGSAQPNKNGNGAQ